MKARFRRRLALSDVSQSKLKRFIREANRRGRFTLPEQLPRTLAVVVPCYSHAAYLPDTLASILAQTRPPDEVVFIDDCSPDATGEILRSFIASHPWTAGPGPRLLVNDRNIGQAASLNRGIATASSDLVMILNDDDYLMHDAVESLFALFGEYPGVALIGAHNIGISGTEALAAAPKLSTAYAGAGSPLRVHRPEEVAGYRRDDDLNMTHSSSCMFKVAWEAAGGYQTDKRKRVVPFSDRDFQIRVNALFPVAVAYTRPLSFWRNDSSVDRGLNS